MALSLAAVAAVPGLALGAFAAYGFWRHFWFFRNPRRTPPQGQSILSPADGTVVYVRLVDPGQPVLCIKRKREVRIDEITGEDHREPLMLIGVFMSPFNVHYNRAPISGTVEAIRHHPAKTVNHTMGSMHWRTITGRLPIYENSPHIVENERTVTLIRGPFRGAPVSCYVVQIAGGSVRGIDSYIPAGGLTERGNIFGMIRVGSQVDTVVTWRPGMFVKVHPGDRVKAGESVLID
jgi:phosphatidylserine decarboxylase